MPWPDFITAQFALVDRFTADESEYYGPFNALLNSLFPASENYQVAPQFKPIRGWEETIDFAIVYVVMKQKTPVFLLEIDTYLAFDKCDRREEADNLMRERFLDFSSRSRPLPKLYGVSALGTRFSIYEYHPNTRTLTPQFILPCIDILNDTAPQERWNYDIMEPEGEVKLKQIVGEIKEMAAALSQIGIL